MIVGPMNPMPRPLMGGGALARAISSCTIACCIGVALRPPYSFGHSMPMKPASYILRCQALRSSRVFGSMAGVLVSNQRRVASRKARSSGASVRSIGLLLGWMDVSSTPPEANQSGGTRRTPQKCREPTVVGEEDARRGAPASGGGFGEPVDRGVEHVSHGACGRPVDDQEIEQIG